jgi:hypothetical protein
MNGRSAKLLRSMVKDAVKQHPNFSFRSLYRQVKRDYARTPWHLKKDFSIFT